MIGDDRLELWGLYWLINRYYLVMLELYLSGLVFKREQFLESITRGNLAWCVDTDGWNANGANYCKPGLLCHRKQLSTFKHWSFIAVWVAPSLAPSAKPEAELVSIDIVAVFTVFLRTFYSMMVLKLNILAFHQQNLSGSNVKNMCACALFQKIIEALGYKSAYVVDTKKCWFHTLHSAFEACIGC